jgi:hypothetical protein
MPKAVHDTNEVPWVDVFSEKVFGGRLTRLRARAGDRTRVYDAKKLPRIESVIVGPGATAEFLRNGRPNPVRLSQRTVLPDAAHLLNGKGILCVRVRSAKRRVTNPKPLAVAEAR